MHVHTLADWLNDGTVQDCGRSSQYHLDEEVSSARGDLLIQRDKQLLDGRI